jgi:glycosyltransferase involved in cell wall biosynthesis
LEPTNPKVNTQKPRLLVSTSTLPRFEEDPEPRFVIDLARALADRFEITVLAPSFPDAAARATLFGVDVIRYRYAPFKAWEQLAYPGGIMPRLQASPLNWLLVPGLLLGQAIALRRLLRKQRFDLVHAHWTLPQGFIAATIPNSIRPPLVVTSHGGDVFTLGRGPLRRLIRHVLRRASASTVVSAELLEECQQILAPLDTSSRLHHIPMGVDSEHFAQAASNASRPTDMPSRGQVILFIGRLAPKKGVGVLLQALAEPGVELSSAQLVVIGDGPMRDTWQALARRLNLEQRVHFLGPRHHQALPAYLASADVIALPSVHTEDGDKDGLPVTLMEAAACSVAAVASNLAGIPEFIEDGYNGLLVPPGDSRALASALTQLLSDPALRRACSKAALATARKFDWSSIANRYAAVFYSVLAAQAPPASTVDTQHHINNGLDETR